MRLIKILLSIIIIVILLAVVAGILLVTVIDPNHFKGQISHAVEAKTGRQLVINGAIERSVFPWLGVKVRDVELSNAPQFSASGKFLTVGEADIRVQLLPLFSKRVEIEKLTLKDVTLNLMKNSNGQSNWDDLTARHAVQSSATPSPAPAVATSTAGPVAATSFAIMVAGIDVSNANVNYLNQQNGQSVQLSNMTLRSKGVGMNEAFPISLALDLKSNKP